MYVVIVDFLVAAEHCTGFRTHVIENARLSRKVEPGCRRFDVCVDPIDAAQVFLYELYDDRAAFEAHLRSAHFLAFDALVKPWILEKKVRSLVLVDSADAP